MKLKTCLILSLTTPAAAWLAGALCAPGAEPACAETRPAVSACNARPPLTLGFESLDPDPDPLSTNTIGLISVHVGATTDLDEGTVKVVCSTSSGVSIFKGPTTFVDTGKGVDLVLEKHDSAPQWLLLSASVERPDAETFHSYEFFGAAPQPVIQGAVEQGGVVFLVGEQL